MNPLREQGATMDAGAVEVMARAGHYAYEQAAPSMGWETNPRSRVPWEEVPDENRAVMLAAYGAALAALTSPRTVECPECRYGPADSAWPDDPCPSCSGSGRIEKGPIAYLADSLVQVGWTDRDGLAFTARMDAHRESFGVPIFRIVPDESPKGGA